MSLHLYNMIVQNTVILCYIDPPPPQICICSLLSSDYWAVDVLLMNNHYLSAARNGTTTSCRGVCVLGVCVCLTIPCLTGIKPWRCNISSREPATFTVTWDKTISKANKPEACCGDGSSRWTRRPLAAPLAPRATKEQTVIPTWLFCRGPHGAMIKTGQTHRGGPLALPFPRQHLYLQPSHGGPQETEETGVLETHIWGEHLQTPTPLRINSSQSQLRALKMNSAVLCRGLWDVLLSACVKLHVWLWLFAWIQAAADRISDTRRPPSVLPA